MHLIPVSGLFAVKTNYLFRRPGSQNWYLKLQYTGDLAERVGKKRVEKSLGTPNRAEAEIRALPFIEHHKRTLFEQQRARDFAVISKPKLEPGREHHGADGERIIATDTELIYLTADGAILRTEPNSIITMGLPPLGKQIAAVRRERHRQTRRSRSGDDAIIDTYLMHAKVTGYNKRETLATWELYKQLTDGKSLAESSRDDGRKIVKHFQDKNLKSATIAKKVGWLNAAVNLAIDESKLRFNPFSRIVPKADDMTQRLPLSEEDIKLVKMRLKELQPSDQFLFVMLASTGMRLSEAFEIDREFEEHGCRYTIVGKKSLTSKRRIPFPKCVLALLPKQIEGPLFVGSIPAASKRLNRFLTDIGITDPRKVIHSLRHRAQDRLRAANCPRDYRWAILGHEIKTVAEGYGEGFPVTLLKKWVDRIGF